MFLIKRKSQLPKKRLTTALHSNMGLLDAPVASYKPHQYTQTPQVVQTPHNPISYQTMSDFEVKALAELNRLATGYEKLFNAIKTIELSLPNQEAMSLYESDDILTDLQNKGLEPKSNL